MKNKNEISQEEISKFIEIISSFSLDIVKRGMKEIINGKILLPWRKSKPKLRSGFYSGSSYKESISRDALCFKRAIVVSSYYNATLNIAEYRIEFSRRCPKIMEAIDNYSKEHEQELMLNCDFIYNPKIGINVYSLIFRSFAGAQKYVDEALIAKKFKLI